MYIPDIAKTDYKVVCFCYQRMTFFFLSPEPSKLMRARTQFFQQQETQQEDRTRGEFFYAFSIPLVL